MVKTPPEQILDRLEERLSLLTVANGYDFTLVKIKRATLENFKGDDLPAVNFWTMADERVQGGAGWVERQLTVAVEVYGRTRDEPFVDAAMRHAFNVALAVMRSPDAPTPADNPDLTLGGMVRTVQLGSITPQVGQGQEPWFGSLVTFSLVYRVSSSNPLLLVL